MSFHLRERRRGAQNWGQIGRVVTEIQDSCSWAALVAQLIKNPPANAGDAGKVPDPERIPYAPEKLSLSATTTEPVLQSPGATSTGHTCCTY